MRHQNLNGKKFTRFGKMLIMCMALITAISFSAIPAESYAASKTVKMTGYNKVLKMKNTVYVAGAGDSIYKVTVKKGVVKSKKKITKGGWVMGPYSYTSGMKKKGKYLYIKEGTEGTLFYLSRVNLSNGKTKVLVTSFGENGPQNCYENESIQREGIFGVLQGKRPEGHHLSEDPEG